MSLRVLFIIALIGLSGFVFGQKGTITIIDAKTKEQVPFAHVCFEELDGSNKQYVVSANNGIVANISLKQTVVAISCVGYKTQIDTVYPGKDYLIYLSPKVFDIDQVVVTASFVPQKVDKSIYNVKVLDRRQIEQKAANNLSELLKDEVNLQVTNDPALGSSLRLKGLGGNNVKILIDGVPIIGRMGGNIDLSQLNLYNIDHVEIVEGPMSVIYGSNALAGVINIITKENLYSRYNFSSNTYYESIGTFNLNGSLSVNQGKNNISISGARNFFNGVYLETDTNRSQQWKPKELYNADLNYSFSNEKNKIRFQSSLMDEKLLDKGDQLSPSFRNAIDSWFYSLRFTNRLEYNRKLNSNYFIKMEGSQSYYQRKKLTYLKDFIESSSSLVDDGLSNDTSVFSSYSYRLNFGNQNNEKKFSFISGLDLNYETATGKRILNEEQSIGDYAFFASALYNLNHNLSIQSGLRLAENTRFEVPFVPSLNIKWNAFSFLNIRASYARGYRAPTLKELYILFKDINHDIQPNENLKPEKGHNFDVSFNINTEKIEKLHFSNIELSLFYNQISNIIYLAPENISGIYKYINISNYNTIGGKVGFKYDFYPYFDFGFGFGETGTFASFAEKNQSLSKYKFSPEANLNLSFNLSSLKIKIITNYKYSGKIWLFSLDENNTISSGYRDSYHNLDLTLLRKFFKNKVSFSIGVKNVFNNTLIKSSGGVSDAVHSSSDGSPVGYGRVYFTSLSYNIFR